jgi:hypothetical protein
MRGTDFVCICDGDPEGIESRGEINLIFTRSWMPMARIGGTKVEEKSQLRERPRQEK